MHLCLIKGPVLARTGNSLLTLPCVLSNTIHKNCTVNSGTDYKAVPAPKIQVNELETHQTL